MFSQDNSAWSTFKVLVAHQFSTKTITNENEAFRFSWDKTSTMRNNPELWTKLEKLDGVATGYSWFMSTPYKEADMYYLHTLCCAKYEGVTHGKCLMNLAWLRYDKGKFHQCIELIDMCEKTEYPKKYFPKLYITKIWALKRIGDNRTATETCGQLRELLPTLGLSKSEQNNFLDEANEVLKELPDKKIKKYCHDELIVPEMEESLTSKAEIRKGGVRGTIVRATKNIKRGEPILVEKMLVTSVITQFCMNCNSPNEIPHPCESCRIVLYCSKNCKKADTETHKLCCTLYQTKVFPEVSEFIYEPFVLFTKGYTLKVFHDFKAFTKDFETFVKTLAACCIVVHHIMENRQILKMLVDKNIVKSGLGTSQTAYEIGRKLLELAVILKFNREPYDQGDGDNYSFFPQYISFEHSCAPNTSKYLSGNKIVVKAVEDIEIGDEITVCYGNFLYSNYVKTAKRQEELKKNYGFRCQCRACKNLNFEAELNGVIKCDTCGFYMRFEPSRFVCENCSSSKQMLSKLRKIEKLLNNESRISIGKRELLEKIKRFKELEINPSHKAVVSAHLILARNELDQGNVKKAMKIVVTSNGLQGPFNKFFHYHYSIFKSLQTYLKRLHSSDSRRRIKFEIVDIIEKFLNAFESLVNLYYPKRLIVEEIEEVCKYLSIIKQTGYSDADKFEWNTDDCFDDCFDFS